jgi:hypothetical protein
MNRATVFRIVGFGFLAFAIFTVYQGEFQLGRHDGSTVSRVQDPQTFWQYVVIQAGIGLAMPYLTQREQGR